MDFHSLARGGAAILVIAGGLFAPPLHASSYSYAENFYLLIPSPDDPQSEFQYGKMDDAIEDLDVYINLTHEALFDLQILLQSPEGTYVLLNPAGNMSFIIKDDGGLTAYGGPVQWLFDDEAEVSIEEATEPFSGSFKPAERLSSFDNQDAYGPWRLKIYDVFDSHTGTLESFELAITTPEPATVILLMLGPGLVMLFKPRRSH
jgi:hypothetical protein